MAICTTDRALPELTIANLSDLIAVDHGRLIPEGVRWVTVKNAVFDSETTTLAIPSSLARQLGLQIVMRKHWQTVRGRRDGKLLEPVRLTMLGETCTLDALEVPDDVPVLIG
jgi:hypothetical protein